jgi:hypothetical protein
MASVAAAARPEPALMRPRQELRHALTEDWLQAKDDPE